MSLQELIPFEDVLVGLDPLDKWDCIQRCLDHLIERGRIPADAAGEISEAVLARERSMSTGMERGIAIPHAAVEGIAEVVACLAVVGREKGVNFESIDASPAHFIVLLLIPRSQKLLHIRTLADVARALAGESRRADLLKARTAEEAWSAMSEGA